ncbi:MAG: SH3 domain-containing protein [Tabrizicola sp.]|nr:SH3 domain-containing protein [Tabrizicola sp.]
MRPGLAAAAAQKVLPETVGGAESQPIASRAAAEPVAELAAVAPLDDEPAPVLAALEPATAPDVEPAAYVEPERKLVTAIEEPVFSLSSVGNETSPSAPEAPQPEVAAGGEGTIWYVNASSVNVRAEPSTQAEVVGKLASGEAALMVQAVDSDWARIVIQGDGVEGFVAMRYLSAEAP